MQSPSISGPRGVEAAAPLAVALATDPNARAAARLARARAAGPPARRGPAPAGDADDPSLRPGPDETLDLLSGDWRIFQRRDGHRFSTDDVLGAWYAIRAARARRLRPRRLLDLGTGTGSVGMMLAWRWPRAALLGVEAQELSVGLARRSYRWNGIDGRAEVRLADLRAPEAGIEPGAYDVVTGTPPYFPVGDGIISEKPQCGPCRFELRGGVEDYCLAAARALAPHGVFVLVHAARAEARCLAAVVAAGLRVARHRIVVPRAGREPLLVLIEADRGGAAAELARPARRGGRADATTREPALCVRGEDGARTEAFRRARVAVGFPPGA